MIKIIAAFILLVNIAYGQTDASRMNYRNNYPNGKSSSVQQELSNVHYATDWPGVVPDADSATMSATAGSTTVTMTGVSGRHHLTFLPADKGKTFSFPAIGPTSAPDRLFQQPATASYSDSYTIAGSLTSGTFQVGEHIIQTSTGASGYLILGVTSSPMRVSRVLNGTSAPDATHTWVGSGGLGPPASGAIFTPTALPVESYAMVPEAGGQGPASVMSMIGTLSQDGMKTPIAGTSMTYAVWCIASASGSGPGAIDWELDGSDDPTFASFNAVYTGSNIQAWVNGEANTLTFMDTYRIRMGVDSGPFYNYYRPQLRDHASGGVTHPYCFFTGNTYVHYLTGKITAVTDATHATMSSAAALTVPGVGVEYGTDNAPGVLAAEKDVCGGDPMVDGCYLPSTLIFPQVKLPDGTFEGVYFFNGSIAADYTKWIGYSTQFDFATGMVPSTVNTVLCGAYGFGVTPPTPPNQCQAAPDNSALWEQNTPFLIRFGNMSGGDSQGAMFEGITVDANAVPANGWMCETCEEQSGLLNSSIDNIDGRFGARHVLVMGNSAENSSYYGLQNVAANNITPPPMMYLTSAVTTPGSQTFTVNRTDWFGCTTSWFSCGTTQWLEWRLNGDGPYFEVTIIDANCTSGACRVSGNVLQPHAINDNLMVVKQPVSIDAIGVSSQIAIDNSTLVASLMPGWGYDIRSNGANISTKRLHLEGAFAGIQNRGNGAFRDIDTAYNVGMIIDNKGYIHTEELDTGAPPAFLAYFDAVSNTSLFDFFVSGFDSIGTEKMITGNGYLDLFGGMSRFSNQGAFIKQLVFGNGTNFARLGIGNQATGIQTTWDQGGNSNGILQWKVGQLSGGVYSYPDYTHNIWTIDTGNGFGYFHPSYLTFGDGGGCGTGLSSGGSVYYPHDATTPIPFLGFGHDIGGLKGRWCQTGSSGGIINFDGWNGSTWTNLISLNLSASTVSILGTAPAPGMAVYDLPPFYDASGWHAYSIAGLLNFLSNSTSLNVGNAVGWDGSKLNNLTGLNLMTTLAGGASFSNAYSPTKWTGSALIQMSNADLGNFMGLGSSSTPMMMVYQGNTNAFTVQTIPAATTPANSPVNIPYYNYGWLSYTPTSFLTNFLNVTIPSSEQMLTTNGAAYFTRPILPFPTTSILPQVWNGSYWAGATPAAIGAAMFPGTTPTNNHVFRWSTSLGYAVDGGATYAIGGTIPSHYNVPSGCVQYTVISDSANRYECLAGGIWMRQNASGNSISF